VLVCVRRVTRGGRRARWRSYPSATQGLPARL